jgi:glycosyltransferase involved in cell wall biosynthesis
MGGFYDAGPSWGTILGPVRLLHVVDRLSDRGGAFQHLLGVLESLAPQHDLLLAAGRDEGGLRPPCPTRVVPGLDERTSRPVALDDVVRAFRPDVIHVHNLMNPAVLEWAGARTDTVVTVQDHRYFCPTRGKWTLEGNVCRVPMDRSECASCFEDAEYFDGVYALTERRRQALRGRPLVVLSSYMKDALSQAGLPAETIHVVPPFVHGLDRAAEADGPPCVLFVGRLVEAKGVRDAFEAWRRADVGLPLVVAGTGPLRESLLRAGIEALGWVDRTRLARLYRRARALLMPSRWQEPFGIVGIEALAFGVPVVAWDSGGVREWHPGPGLVAWGDVDGLARALREALRQTMEPLERFDALSSTSRLLEVYAKLAAFGGGNRLPAP